MKSLKILSLIITLVAGIFAAQEIYNFRRILGNTASDINSEITLVTPKKTSVDLKKISNVFQQNPRPAISSKDNLLSNIRILGRIVSGNTKKSKLIIETDGIVRLISENEMLNQRLKVIRISPTYFTAKDHNNSYIIEFTPTLSILSNNRLIF